MKWWYWVLIALVLLFGGLVLRIVFFPSHIANRAVDTAYGVVNKTLNADNAIFNYELFHDLYQGVQQAEANIKAQDQAVADLQSTYGKEAAKWPKDVRERHAFLMDTRSGYITQYNRLASDYNAQSRKLNRNLFKDRGLPYDIPLWGA